MIRKTLDSGWEHYRGSLGGVWEVWRRDKLATHFDVPWQHVRIPHCFNAFDTVDPDCTYYQGQAWYRNYLNIQNTYPEGRTLLHFEGVGQSSKVFVHTEEVGSHRGGYDEFTVDISEAVQRTAGIDRYNGRVPVAVMCDNSRDLETIPSDISDFNLYGGIYRKVSLVCVPAVSIERVHVRTEEVSLGKANIRVSVRLYNPGLKKEPLDVTVVLADPSGKESGGTCLKGVIPWDGSRELLQMEIDNPVLWSTEKPFLYQCTVKVEGCFGSTEMEESFGVRFFEFCEKGPFFLNGERVLLKGTHRHDDFAGVGAAMTDEMLHTEMHLIKEMGANFIRLGHYQQSQTVLNLCDRLGILVWEEIPWCRGGLGGETYRRQCRDMLSAMIDQHFNHPSVIIWGLGNENDWEGDFDHFNKEEIREFMKELRDIAHNKDSGRMTAIRRCDFCKDIVDVYSPSIWAGWYRGIYTEYEDYTRLEYESVDRFLHMEWGADNLAGRHVEKAYTGFEEIRRGQGADERNGDFMLHSGDPRVSSLGDWSETYFCDMVDWYLKTQESLEWLTGTAQWAFKDFSTPVRPDSPVPYMNLKGIVQRDFTRKEAYYVFQSYWTQRPMARIYGHDMDVRWGKPEEHKMVRVYSNCLEAELYLNGSSCGRRRRKSEDFPCAGLRWDVVFQPGSNHLKVVAWKKGIQVEDEVSFTYQVETWEKPAHLKLTSKLQEKGLYFIEARAYDRNNVYCPDASQFVRFDVTGHGKLIDNLGTVKGSRYVKLASGKAGIYVEAFGEFAVASVISESIKGDYVVLG